MYGLFNRGLCSFRRESGETADRGVSEHGNKHAHCPAMAPTSQQESELIWIFTDAHSARSNVSRNFVRHLFSAFAWRQWETAPTASLWKRGCNAGTRWKVTFVRHLGSLLSGIRVVTSKSCDVQGIYCIARCESLRNRCPSAVLRDDFVEVTVHRMSKNEGSECCSLPPGLSVLQDYLWPIARTGAPLPVLLAAGTQTGPASVVNVSLSENHPWIPVDCDEKNHEKNANSCKW